MADTMAAIQNQVCEWGYTSNRKRTDPFNEVTVEVTARHQDGQTWRLPAYWSGDLNWRVRFLPNKPGMYDVQSVCSDTSDNGLHGMISHLEVEAVDGGNPLFTRGPLQVSKSGRTLAFADGTPFFWLGDTWWMGLCSRLSWPDDFQHLTADRVAKGFSLVQIVAGLYPDMPGFDERGANEAGFPWEKDYARINPRYFDMADLRIRWLVRNGLVPCIVGCWGYYLPELELDRMKRHWRYLVARWGAYPVVWCLAGEAAMPFYLSTDRTGDADRQTAGWTELGRFVREIDPYSRLLTIHPTQIGRDQVNDDSVLDIDMLQTGHGGYNSVPNAVRCVTAERRRDPVKPVVIGETNYEGIIHSTHDEVQRLTFWASFLSGAAGYTYGANGIWQVNTRAAPYGPSPHGGNWGNTPWDDAARLPGAAHLGLARKLLEAYPWWEFEPHQDWVRPSASPDDVNAAFAAGIPRCVRIVYSYNPVFPWSKQPMQVLKLEQNLNYDAFFWDPRTAERQPIGTVRGDADGCWTVPVQPTFDDWVLVLEARD